MTNAREATGYLKLKNKIGVRQGPCFGIKHEYQKV
jgi:hypothetical protein